MIFESKSKKTEGKKGKTLSFLQRPKDCPSMSGILKLFVTGRKVCATKYKTYTDKSRSAPLITDRNVCATKDII